MHKHTCLLDPVRGCLKLGQRGAEGVFMTGLQACRTTESLMHMLYNSDSYAVVQIDVAVIEPTLALDEVTSLTRGGYEIVDKFARKEMFIEGALAESFKVGVEALIETSPSIEEFDAYLEGFAGMAQQPVVMH